MIDIRVHSRPFGVANVDHPARHRDIGGYAGRPDVGCADGGCAGVGRAGGGRASIGSRDPGRPGIGGGDPGLTWAQLPDLVARHRARAGAGRRVVWRVGTGGVGRPIPARRSPLAAAIVRRMCLWAPMDPVRWHASLVDPTTTTDLG